MRPGATTPSRSGPAPPASRPWWSVPTPTAPSPWSPAATRTAIRSSPVSTAGWPGRGRRTPELPPGDFGQFGGDARHHLVPIAGRSLVEKARRRIPRAVLATVEPAPVTFVTGQNPDRFGQRAGQVSDG